MTIKIGSFQLSIGRARKITTPDRAHRRGWNIARWKSSPPMIDGLREFYSTPVGQNFLSVLHSEIPRGYASVQPGQQLGRINGFLECLSLIDNLAEQPPLEHVEPEATFGAENFEEPIVTET